MKNKIILALIPAMLLLSACETTSFGSSSVVSDNGQSSSTSSTVSDSLTSSDASDSTSSSSSMSEDQTGWTADQIALMEENLGGQTIPFLSMEGIVVSFDSDYSCVTVIGTTPSDALNAYNAVLGAAGYSSQIIEDATYGDYIDATVFDAEYNFIEVQAYEADTAIFEIDAYYNASLSTWPETAVSTFLTSISATTSVPAFQAQAYQAFDYSDSGYFEVIAFGKSSVAETEEVYTSALTALGYAVDNSNYASAGIVATSAAYDVAVQYYYEGDAFYIVIAAGEAPVGDLTFDFSTEDQISGTKDTSLTTWISGSYTFALTKGNSTTSVGNPSSTNSYYANPLRVYTGQIITISWDASTSVSSLTFACDVTTKDVSGLVEGTFTGAVLSSSGNSTAVFVPNSAVTTIEIVASAQFRLLGVAIA